MSWIPSREHNVYIRTSKLSKWEMILGKTSTNPQTLNPISKCLGCVANNILSTLIHIEMFANHEKAVARSYRKNKIKWEQWSLERNIKYIVNMKNLKTHHTSCSQSHENETMGGKEKQKKMICIWPNGLFLKEKKGKQINNWQTPTHKKMETWRRKRKASIGSKTCALSICNPRKWLSEVKVYLSSTKKDASKNSSSLSEEEAGAWMLSAIATAKKFFLQASNFQTKLLISTGRVQLKVWDFLESCLI